MSDQGSQFVGELDLDLPPPLAVTLDLDVPDGGHLVAGQLFEIEALNAVSSLVR